MKITNEFWILRDVFCETYDIYTLVYGSLVHYILVQKNSEK